ncbi:unnamed protein product [Calypogeia fissa]
MIRVDAYLQFSSRMQASSWRRGVAQRASLTSIPAHSPSTSFGREAGEERWVRHVQLPPGGSPYVQAPRAGDCYASGSPGISQEGDRRPDLRMMTPESRSDQGSGGYGGLQRISVTGVSPSNNAMEILSRFRPIAPKPMTPKPGESAGSAASDPPSTSTLSFDRAPSGKAVTSERSRVKRSRKRAGADPLLPPTRRPKRGQTPSRPRAVSSNGPTAVGGIQKAVEQFAPDNKSGLQPMLPTANGGGEYRLIKGGASNATHGAELAPPTQYILMGDASEGLGGWVRPDRRKFQGFGAFKMPPMSGSNEWASSLRGASSQDGSPAAAPANEGSPAAEEPAFMGRAAAASTSQPYVGRELNGVPKMKGGGGYDRGFDSYQKCVVDVDAYRTEMMGHSWPFPMYGVAPNTQRMVDQFSHGRSNGENSEVISDGNSREQNTPEAPKPLVTLSLLPRDSPSQSNTTSAPIRPTASKHVPCLELSLTSDTRDWNKTRPESPEELHKLTLFNHRSYEEERRNGFRETDTDRSGGTSSSSDKDLRAGRMLQEPLDMRLIRVPSRESEGSGVSVTDTLHMEQQYSASSEPMMISDDLSGEILWANQAYMKADAERNQRFGKAKEGPYLDVLGIPTKMSSFDFRTQQGAITNANLWGFLKKFMKSGPSRDSSPSPLEGRADEGAKEIRTPERKSSSGTGEDFRESPQNNTLRKLITPQPNS